MNAPYDDAGRERDAGRLDDPHQAEADADAPTASDDGTGVLEGAISVLAALRAASRPVERILIRRDVISREAGEVRALARAAGVPVEKADEAGLARYTTGRTHGGIVAQVGARRFVTLEALIPAHGAAFIVMLDGVEDPFNFGQAVRAFYAAGAHGLVVRPRSWMSAAGVVARASAGASEWMPTAVADTAAEAAERLRAHGLRVAVTDRVRAVSLYEADLTGPLFLVVGGEKRGVTRSFADAADLRVKIPYARPFAHSLGTTGAAAALAFEVMRQRMTGSA